MYVPPAFQPKELEWADKICRQFPFATVISGSSISHLPLTLESSLKEGATIWGHLARANPHFQTLQKNPDILCLFHGPHTYITPKYYVSGRDVPTWNYIAVHVHGRVKLIEDFDGINAILKKQTEFFEAASNDPWQFELPSDLLNPVALTRAITNFSIEVTRIEAKFKLNQNRPAGDFEGVLSGLSERSDDNSRGIKEWMQAVRKPRAE